MYNLLVKATYVPENVVAAFCHISFLCVVLSDLLSDEINVIIPTGHYCSGESTLMTSKFFLTNTRFHIEGSELLRCVSHPKGANKLRNVTKRLS